MFVLARVFLLYPISYLSSSHLSSVRLCHMGNDFLFIRVVSMGNDE